MSQSDNDAEQGQTKSHSVSSGRRSNKTISFNVPTFERPEFKDKNWRPTAIIAAFVAVAFISGIAGAAFETRNDQLGLSSGSLSNQKKVVTSQSNLINQIAKSVGPSVVSVNVSITSTSNQNSGFGLYGFSQPEQEQAAGTGIIISSGGIIVTNRHVVPDGTTNVSVTLSDGTELKDVSVLGRTSSSDSLDVAFLKINNTEGHKLTPAAIGDSAQVQVGDAVVAIGNALGQYQNTVTSGIISGYGRSVQASASDNSSTENLDDLFQTDAAINEGNSGGPLVNMNGQVIGINTAVASDSQNIGFSIPINDVKGLINQVLKSGNFSRPYLGVRYIPLTADVANEYNLKVQNGAFVAPSSDSSTPSVVSGSPADKAGIQTNDIITSVNGKAIDQTHSLTSLLDQYQPGDKIKLTVVRGGKTMTVTVTLGTMPSSSN